VKYDAVLGPSSTQADAFNLIDGYVNKALDGYNCTVLAYGQTGTGKTYTMSGGRWTTDTPVASSEDGPDAQSIERAQQGVIPRAFEKLFQRITELSFATAMFSVQTSFLEVYNEKIYDLLAKRSNSKRADMNIAGQRRDSLNKELLPLPLKEKARKVFVDGLRKVAVRSMPEMEQLLEQASSQRAIRDTMYNEHSSRSHTLFQVHISKQEEKEGKNVITSSKLNFVDLAGSEKWKTSNGTGAEHEKMTGMHLKEMTAINKSLSALGSCINALAEEGRVHIPYRDSKLTRLLQDSLGGDSHVAFVVTICGTEGRMDETHSSLKFADRARCVVTMPTVCRMVTEEPGGVQRAKYYEQQISSLRSNLRRMRQQLEAAQKQRKSSEEAQAQAETKARDQMHSRKAEHGSEQAAAASTAAEARAKAETQAKAAENAKLWKTLKDTKRALELEQKQVARMRRERDEARCAEEAAKVVVGEAAAEEVRREMEREQLLQRARAEGVTGNGIHGGSDEHGLPGVNEFSQRGEAASTIMHEEPSKLYTSSAGDKSAIQKPGADSIVHSESHEASSPHPAVQRRANTDADEMEDSAELSMRANECCNESDLEMRQLMDELVAEERRLESILEEEAKIQRELARRQVQLESVSQKGGEKEVAKRGGGGEEEEQQRQEQHTQRQEQWKQEKASSQRQGVHSTSAAEEVSSVGGEESSVNGRYHFDPAYQPTATTAEREQRRSNEKVGLSDEDGLVYRECGRGARVVQIPRSLRSDPRRHSIQEGGGSKLKAGTKGGTKKVKKGKKAGGKLGGVKRNKKQTWEEKLAEEGRRQHQHMPRQASAPPPNHRPPLQPRQGIDGGYSGCTAQDRDSREPFILPRMGPSEFELRRPVSESDMRYEDRQHTQDPSPPYARSEGDEEVWPMPAPPPGQPSRRQAQGYRGGRGPRRQRERSRERSTERSREPSRERGRGASTERSRGSRERSMGG
jgi:hypothetical protein